MPNTTDATQPSYTRPEVIAAQADLELVTDLCAGTRRMWERSKTYIRKWKDEDELVYDIRRTIETVFEGFSRTLSAAIGMMFAKPPAIEWNQSEAAIIEHWDNVDAAGTKGTVFVKRFAEAAIRDGLAVILVDHAPPPEGVTIHGGNEKALGLRPTWAFYPRSSVASWRVGKQSNQTVLTQLVLREVADVDDGTFGSTSVTRFRALRLVDGVAYWTLFELAKADAGKEHFRVVGSGVFRNRTGTLCDRIPVGIAYTGRTDAPMTASIPLLGVAWANLAHWQLSTALRFYREISAFPQPVVIGEIAKEAGQNGQLEPGRLRVGPMVAVRLQGEGASFSWAELEGTSMEQLEKGILEKLQQISKLGMSFLASDTRAAETAEAKRLDATSENSTLATAAQGIEDAVNTALELHAWFLGIDKAGAPVLTISRDYESTAMDPATMAAYVQAVRDAGLPVRLLLEAWQAGGRIPDTDLEDLALEMEANAAAEAERQRQELEQQRAAPASDEGFEIERGEDNRVMRVRRITTKTGR